MSTLGHPDWTPVTRGYAGGLIYPLTNHTLPAHTNVQVPLVVAQLYDVNVVNALLPRDCAMEARSAGDVGLEIVGPFTHNAGLNNEAVVMPFHNKGGGATFFLTNYGAVQRIASVAIRGYNGVLMGDLLMPAQVYRQPNTVIIAGATVDVLSPAGAGLFDSCSWFVNADQAFDVVMKVPVFNANTVAYVTQTLASGAAGATLSGAFNIPAGGFVLQVKNTSGVNLNASGTAKLFRYGTT